METEDKDSVSGGKENVLDETLESVTEASVDSSVDPDAAPVESSLDSTESSVASKSSPFHGFSSQVKSWLRDLIKMKGCLILGSIIFGVNPNLLNPVHNLYILLLCLCL